MSDALVPYKDIEAMAAQVVKSRMFPGINTNEAAITLMLLCQAEGLHPMQALTRYHIISGRPAMKADAMLAEFMRRGGTVKWVEWTNEACEAIFTSAGVPDGVKVRWTLEDAKRAGVTGNPTWSKYPRQMLKARVASDGVRMADPVVNQGRYTPEELQDVAAADRKTADYEVVGDEAGNVMSGKTGDPPAPPAIESATGLTTEEHLAEAKRRRDEALAEFAPPPTDDDAPIEAKLEAIRAEAKKRREEAAAEYAPPPTDDDAPIEAKLEAIRSRSNEKHGRPRSVPDFCKCGQPVMKFVSSDGSREYWECSSRHADRYKLRETGMADAQIRKMIATSNPECFFKDAGKVTS